MANGQVYSVNGLVDKRRGRIQTGPNPHANAVNMGSINEMRARLIAINAAYYTAAKLDAMTVNDMIYALRDTASI